MMKRLFSVLTAMLLAASLFAGCASNQDKSKDDIRIVSTAADITEIIDGLEASEYIAIADTYSMGIGNVDPEVCTMEYMTPDIEAILMLDPTCVFVSGSSTDGTVDPYSELVNAGVNVVYIPTADSIDGIKDNIDLIAKNISAEKKADKLIKSIDDAVAAAKKRAEGKDEVSVYFEISAAPWLYSFGSGTFLNDIISICGGKNIYSDQNGWLSNTEESVIAADPQLILTNVMYNGYDPAEICSRPGWESLSAVKNGRVVSIDTDASSRGSQNIVKAIEEISNAIIPD